MRATPKQLQKPQLVVATRGDGGGKKPQHNEDSPSEEEWPACMAATVTEGDRDTGSETARERHVRHDMAIPIPFMTQPMCPIRKNLQPIAFEKQLSYIDATIAGGASVLEMPLSLDGMQVYSADLQTTAQGKRVNEDVEKKEDRLEKWARPKVDLGQKGGHLDLPTKPINTINTTAIQVLENEFVMGLQTPKPPGVDKNKTKRGPTQKRSIVGCGQVHGKENKLHGAQGHVHGKEKENVTSIEVEANDVGTKRKECIPLKETLVNDETVKKRKLDGEVMTLGKIMAQHLGSALAARQPRREQGVPYVGTVEGLGTPVQ